MKFEIYDQETKMMKRLGYDEAVRLDEELESQIAELEKGFFSLQREYDRLDSLCIEAGKEVSAALTAGSPRVREFRQKLLKIALERDSVKVVYETKKKKIDRDREQLASSLIFETAAKWDEIRLSLPKKLEVLPGGEYMPNVFTGSTFKVSSNERAIRAAMDFSWKKILELRSLRVGVQRIFDFIKATELEYSSFDLNAFTEEVLNQGLHSALMERISTAQSPPSPGNEMAVLSGDGSFIKLNPKKGGRP